MTEPDNQLSPLRSAADEPRLDPALRALLAAFGLDRAGGQPPMTADAPLAERLAFAAGMEEAFEGLYSAFCPSPDLRAITVHTETVSAEDGSSLRLDIFAPDERPARLPAVVYLHGGGMTLLTATNNVHTRWCAEIARQTPAVVVRVDFRNAAGTRGAHPFPTGLRDCLAGVRWVGEHAAELGVDRIVVQGESGGGNLAVATALLAKREGQRELIDGVYAAVPYVSGAYGWPESQRREHYPSMLENNGYLVDCAMSAILASVYDPGGAHATDPLCWPVHATEQDLRGLPPCVVTVNELDIYRDEGLALYRTLQRAEVPVTGRVNLGLTHGAELMHAEHPAFGQAVAQVGQFARALATR